MIDSKDNETNETQVTNPIDAMDEDDAWESSDNETDDEDDLYNTDGLIKPTEQMVIIDKANWDLFVEFSMKNALNIREVTTTKELMAYDDRVAGLPLMWYSSDCSYD